jgi:hypothetical protein
MDCVAAGSFPSLPSVTQSKCGPLALLGATEILRVLVSLSSRVLPHSTHFIIESQQQSALMNANIAISGAFVGISVWLRR